MKNIFSIIDTQPCHPDPRLAGLVSGSDPYAQVTRCRNKFGMTCGRHAFTLAEVLITLGIIGIVAAITIPALITNYQSRVNETAAMVFETRLEQALQQMNIAEDLTGPGSTAEFLAKLKNYMKIINTCEAGKLEPCFSDKVNDWKTAELDFMGTKTWGTVVEAFVLQNGTTALIKYNKNCKSPGMAAKGSELRNCIAITYDTNGLKKPNQVGKDIGGNASFMIKLPSGLFITSGDVPYEPDGTNYWLGAKNTCEKLGLRLPSNGGNTTIAGGSCPGGDNIQNNDTYKGSEACQIFDWCKTSACTDVYKVYWLNEVFSVTPANAYGFDALSGAVGTRSKDYTLRYLRCVE